MTRLPPPIPDRLRPRPTRRRRKLVGVLLMPLLLLPLAFWRVRTVEIVPCPGLPESCCSSLRQLEGTWPCALPMGWIRSRVENWPGVAGVQIRLDLPTTLQIIARGAPVAGSVQVGSGWHGVGSDGRLGRRLDGPHLPVIEGFAHHQGDLRRALAAARRLREATGWTPSRVRRVLPGDLEITLRLPIEDSVTATVHVAPDGSRAERAWCERALQSPRSVPRWADLRSDDLMVEAPSVTTDDPLVRSVGGAA
jgi:hypothetical protein